MVTQMDTEKGKKGTTTQLFFLPVNCTKEETKNRIKMKSKLKSNEIKQNLIF